MNKTAPDLPENRQRLVSLIRETGDVIRVGDASKIFGLEPSEAAKVLARWTKQGWLRRIERGVYVAAEIDSLGSALVLDDPWILVPALFSPGYIGGRSAAMHWDLTEQIFNDVFVVSSTRKRQKEQRKHGITFTLRHIDRDKIFGTRKIWRGRTQIEISDPHRTIVDMMNDPTVGGGIQMVRDCFAEYMKRADCNFDTLIEYADRLGNGAVFKRMGYLAEQLTAPGWFIEACFEKRTTGNIKLDPKLNSDHLISRWRLWVPEFMRTKVGS